MCARSASWLTISKTLNELAYAGESGLVPDWGLICINNSGIFHRGNDGRI